MIVRMSVVLAGLLVLAGAAFSQAPDLERMDVVLRSVPDGPIAKVNGVNVPREEFVHMYQNEILGMMARSHSPNIPDRVRVAAAVRTLRLLVEHELLYQEAAKRKYSVSDDEVNAQWTATVDNMKKSLARLKGDGAEQGGSAQDSISDEDILKRANTTKEKALEDLRKGLLVKKVRDKIVEDGKVTVTDDEVASFFNENKDKFRRPETLHLQQVFIATRAGKTPFDETKMADARQRAENALKRLQAGESFEAVAKSVSESPDKSKGGDMGTLPVTALPAFVTEPAAAMKPGEITKVIESDLGLHIFKVLEVMPGSEATLEKVGPPIRQMLLAKKTEEAVLAFCKPSLDDPKKVEVYLQLDKTLAAVPGFEDLKAVKEKPAQEKATKSKDASPKKGKPAKSSDKQQ